jgi:hypothetical protein
MNYLKITIFLFFISSLFASSCERHGIHNNNSVVDDITGYGPISLNSSVNHLLEIYDDLSISDYHPTKYFDDEVITYQRFGDFVTTSQNKYVEERYYIVDSRVAAIEIEFNFTRELHPSTLYDSVILNHIHGKYGAWTPDISLVDELVNLIKNKYVNDLITHDCVEIGAPGEETNVKVIIRDANFDRLLLTWEEFRDHSFLFLIYTNSEFYNQYFDEGEIKGQIDKL